jgi:hypothetical protein
MLGCVTNSTGCDLPTSSSCLNLLQRGSKAAASLNEWPLPPLPLSSSTLCDATASSSSSGGVQAGQAAAAPHQSSSGLLPPRPPSTQLLCKTTPTPTADAAAAAAHGVLGEAIDTLSSQQQTGGSADDSRAAAILAAVPRMPERPLLLLRRLVELLNTHVDELRQLCLEEHAADMSMSGGGSVTTSGSSRGGSSGSGTSYSSLTTAPCDWRLDPARPCSGERLLLVFDRWRKLAKAFWNKGKFDISKVCACVQV